MTKTLSSVCQHCVSKHAKNTLADKCLCDSCFAALCERKLRRNLRNYDLKRDEQVLFLEDTSSKALGHLTHIPLKLTTAMLSNAELSAAALFDAGIIDRHLKEHAAQRIVVPWTMDDENEKFLREILTYKKGHRKDNTQKFQEKNLIKLFAPLSRTETQQYCTIKKIPYSGQIHKSNTLGKMLDAFEKKYPGTKTSIAQSAKDLRQRLSQGAKA
ncbi:hypothetical protein HZB03_04460 [Candidatus Woesearchaeota archaeon]|nr:hypothetical protein [Candidatus Woesearchaeota archaeon]